MLMTAVRLQDETRKAAKISKSRVVSPMLQELVTPGYSALTAAMFLAGPKRTHAAFFVPPTSRWPGI